MVVQKRKNLMVPGIERVTMADQKRKKTMVLSKDARGEPTVNILKKLMVLSKG